MDDTRRVMHVRLRMGVAAFAIAFVSAEVLAVARLVAGLQGRRDSHTPAGRRRVSPGGELALWGTAAACAHANVAASEVGAGLSFGLALAGWCVVDFPGAGGVAGRAQASAAQALRVRRPARRRVMAARYTVMRLDSRIPGGWWAVYDSWQGKVACLKPSKRLARREVRILKYLARGDRRRCR